MSATALRARAARATDAATYRARLARSSAREMPTANPRG